DNVHPRARACAAPQSFSPQSHGISSTTGLPARHPNTHWSVVQGVIGAPDPASFSVAPVATGTTCSGRSDGTRRTCSGHPPTSVTNTHSTGSRHDLSLMPSATRCRAGTSPRGQQHTDNAANTAPSHTIASRGLLRAAVPSPDKGVVPSGPAGLE